MKPHWKIILATLGVILPSLFTYLASRADSNEAKIRAEVAYVTMQETVKELQEATYAHEIELAELRGQHRGRCATVSTAPAPKLKPGDAGSLSSQPKAEPMSDGDGLADAPQSPQIKPRPPSFNDAVQSYKAKK